MGDKKLGFTWYPKDWWTSDSFYRMNAKIRYAYLEILFMMYMSTEGWVELDRDEFNARYRMSLSEQEWTTIVSKLEVRKCEIGEGIEYSSSTVMERMKKIISARKNGEKGGAPVGNANAKKTENQSNEIQQEEKQPKNNPNSTQKQAKEKEKEKIKVKVKEKENIENPQQAAVHPPDLLESFKKFNEWIKSEAPRVTQLKNQITIDEFKKLKDQFPDMKIPAKTLLSMHNYKPLTTKYVDVYLTLKKWISKDAN